MSNLINFQTRKSTERSVNMWFKDYGNKTVSSILFLENHETEINNETVEITFVFLKLDRVEPTNPQDKNISWFGFDFHKEDNTGNELVL